MAGRIAGLVLAAGGGRRLGGRAKALLVTGGELLVDRAVDALRAGGCAPVLVVLGAEAGRVRERARRLAGCTVVENPQWPTGMGSSLRAGLAAVMEPPDGVDGVDGVVVLLVDQPGVGAAAVARVRAAYRSPRTLAAAAYGGERGHPVLLGRDHLAGAARAAAGDRGARDYLRARESEIVLVECGDVARPEDIDTPGDLEPGPAAE
ncbi:nucleotidyltransferase family protein [Streptomyces aidingensis]|uniref:Nicotine blue oxidoreductase n=1 Tax=Streptomyces aidingensis TaxID=910347 RepID=A0A1I1IUC9_9ACTN|nr:NTP transferase domain-containing protein [Streptomyces aidingensis]SFC39521.1 nicotine blue oxidoreductase [Streptomyces aidingensis]